MVSWGHDDRGSELTLLLSPRVLGISSPLPQTQNHGPQMPCLNSCRPVSDFLDEKAMRGLKQIHQQVSVQPPGAAPLLGLPVPGCLLAPMPFPLLSSKCSLESVLGLWAQTLGLRSGCPMWPSVPHWTGRECPPLVWSCCTAWPPSSLRASLWDGGRVVAQRRPCTPSFTSTGGAPRLQSHPGFVHALLWGGGVCVFLGFEIHRGFCDSKLVKYELWVLMLQDNMKVTLEC